ncbi:MAG: hypothetical protein PUD61_05950 [Prevotella sp.]|nr:hypothetical protein [Prevotella sp.]
MGYKFNDNRSVKLGCTCTVSWNGDTILLGPEVTEQLRQNYLVSRDIHPPSPPPQTEIPCRRA